jgi:hypothetical protein
MKMNFDGLLNRTASVFPYRGTNKYPIGNRSNTANYAEMVEVGDDIQFNVCHGWQHTTTEISKAKYDLIKKMKGRNVREDTDTGVCEEYTRTTRPLIVVRSDNTIEFVRDRYWQGDNMKLSDWLRGTVYNSYRVSGTAMSNWDSKSNYTHFPVFGGLRIDAETFEPQNQNIQVFRRLIDRKKSKELMAKYKEAFKSPDAMLKCMDTDTMIVSIKDILDEHFGHDGNTYINTKKCFEIAERMFAEGSNFDGVILHGFAQGIQGFNRWAIDAFQSGQNRSYYRMTEPKNVVPRLLTCMSKKLYREFKPFNEEEVDFKQVRSSEWGIRIVVDGVDIES